MTKKFFPLSPGRVQWKTSMTDSWEINEVVTAQGRRRAVCTQKYPKHVFSITFPLLSDAQVDQLLGFYNLCQGSLLPFLYKDYDHHHVEEQRLSINTYGNYRCVAILGNYLEPVDYVDNVTVYLDGKNVTEQCSIVDGTIAVPGNTSTRIVTATYDYYWRVIFEDSISIKRSFRDASSVSLKLTNIR